MICDTKEQSRPEWTAKQKSEKARTTSPNVPSGDGRVVRDLLGDVVPDRPVGIIVTTPEDLAEDGVIAAENGGGLSAALFAKTNLDLHPLVGYSSEKRIW